MNIFRKIKNKIIFRNSEKKINPDFYEIEISNMKRNVSIFPYDDDDYQEMQSFVYKDLDLLKKNYAAYIKSIQQPLSEEARNRINMNKNELSRILDNMIRNKTTIEQEMKKFEDFKTEMNKIVPKLPVNNPSPDSSPIPRHSSTPDSE